MTRHPDRSATWLHRLMHRKQLDDHLEKELRFHIEQHADELTRQGLPREEALRQARLALGGAEQVKEDCRDARGTGWLENLWRDLNYGARVLRKELAFTIVAVLTLALGIGISSAVFSVVDWLVLSSLPVQAPGELAYLGFTSPSHHATTQFSIDEWREIRSATARQFSDVAAFAFGGTVGPEIAPDAMGAFGSTKEVQLAFVSGNFFSMLGIRPELGRLILPDEGETPEFAPVVVISYRYWQSRFGLDPNIIGQMVSINAHKLQIIGVTPKGFVGPTPVVEMQAYLPLGMAVVESGDGAAFVADHRRRMLLLLARLVPGKSFEAIGPAMKGIGERVAKEYRPGDEPGSMFASPLRPPGIINGEESPLPKTAALFLTLAILVLMLACINVGSLCSMRSVLRRREMAVRSALGAGRGRLIAQLLTESALLALLGGAGGLLVGYGGSRALSSIHMPSDTPFLFDFPFDWRVFAFTFGVSLLAGVAVEILPAWRNSRGNLGAFLHEGGRTATQGRQRLRSVLVAAQVSASLALLIVAGLFLRNLGSVQKADLGFDPRNVLNFTLNPANMGYSEAQGRDFYARILQRVQSLDRVESASLATVVPLGEVLLEDAIQVPGYRASDKEQPSAEYNGVTPDYFKTMRIALLRGRTFVEGDAAGAPQVAVINSAMAKKYWPNQDPIGRQFNMGKDPHRAITVIGVAQDSRMADLYSPISPLFYLPLAQAYSPVITLHVRTRGPAAAIPHEVDDVVQSLAPGLPVFGVRTMTQALGGGNGLFFFRVAAAVTTLLGSLGLLLAVVGVYGVMSYAVSQRSNEIGIRMALGAQAGEVLALICRQGMWLVVTGVAIGLVVAFGIGQAIRDFLVGVTPTDASSYLGVSCLLAGIALAACYVPARRAVKRDPMAVLRHE